MSGLMLSSEGATLASAFLAVTEPLVSPSLASMEILEAMEAVGTLVPPEVVGTSGVWLEWPVPTVYTVL